MKNKFAKLLSVFSISMLLFSCDSNSKTSTNSEESSSSYEEVNNNNNCDELFNEYYDSVENLDDVAAISEDELMYDPDVFGVFANGKYQQLYKNNQLQDENFYEGMASETDDLKYLFYNDNTMRFVNRSDGYAFNIKTDKTFVGDFSVGAYKNRLYNDETTITVSKETKNPYKTFDTYRDDWLVRHVANSKFISDNDMKYSEDIIFKNLSILPGYEVYIYSIQINNPGKIRKMYYNIGIVKDVYDVAGKGFYLLVMKSNHNRNDDFKDLIRSFSVVEEFGQSANHLTNMELKADPNWDETTKKYFDKFSTQDRTDWGIYTSGIDNDGVVSSKMKAFSEAMDYNFDILPTYLHVTSNGRKQSFSWDKAKNLAGGNGFNGKMVLQLSFQYTNNNNELRGSDQYTPMFDMLRGPKNGDKYYFDMRNKIDQVLNELAEAIKNYKEPVLFRVNNEMNSDWVSYCGMMTLLDTDIFIATWRHLYNIFKEHNVTNTIWIFNPVADSCPYSSWGEDMSYFPGNDYVQALGLTYYSDNNANNVTSTTFRKNYTRYYEKNNDIWQNYPWIISEFACGAGGNASGERYRNQASQASYVKGMFDDFKERDKHKYLQNIKGAVWFSCNDSANGKITNQYELVIDKLPLTIEAFKQGLEVNK